MDDVERSKLVEVYLVESGAGRDLKEGALEFLPADAPLPDVGDIILLPPNVTGDSAEQAFLYGGSVAPFRVVEREHLYFRGPGEKHNPSATEPARYMKTWIFVRRISRDEYLDRDPGANDRKAPPGATKPVRS